MTDTAQTTRQDLTKYAWVAIFAALATITLKGLAWWVTGSVGLLSDALESIVNLVTATMALYTLRLAAKPADRQHQFGHTKAEYFSAAFEGQLIFVAAIVIIWTAVTRFLDPQPLEQVGLGLVVSVIATAINGFVAWLLMRVGRKHRSSALVADGKHLLTDVWTTVGVIVGVLGVVLTGWNRLDALIAFAVGVNILVMGWKLLNESANGLMDHTWPEPENQKIVDVVNSFNRPEVAFHGLRTRESGHRRFAELHVLVPGEWTVTQGHDLVEEIEQTVRERFPGTQLQCHLEPLDDPRAYGDVEVELPLNKPQRPH